MKNKKAATEELMTTQERISQERIEGCIQEILSNKENPAPYKTLGGIYYEQKEYEKAISCYKILKDFYHINKCFKTWLQEDEENPEFWLMRSEYFSSEGYTEEAKKYQLTAASLKASSDFKNSLGEIYYEQGEYETAINFYKILDDFFHIEKCFKAWLQSDRENPEIWVMRGDYYLSQGLNEKAVSCYQNAKCLNHDGTFQAAMSNKITEILSLPRDPEELEKARELSEQLHEEAKNHDFYNFNDVNEEFLTQILGVDGTYLEDFCDMN